MPAVRGGGRGGGEPQRPALVEQGEGSDERANPKIESVMDEANKAYDGEDFDQAKAIATKVLAKQPNNVRMLVSSECRAGDPTIAQRYYNMLPPGLNRDQMRKRCNDNGVTLTEPPQ